MSRYNSKETEAKWQAVWDERGSFVAHEDPDRPKYYVLEMFPYPSGRLHVGHARNYAIGDMVAFRATLAVPDDPGDMIAPFDNGGHALRCNLAGVGCTDGVTATYADGDMLFGEFRSLTVDATPGGALTYLFNNDYLSSESLGWGTMTFFNRMAEFTVLSVNQPAPVPLPMSAGLLGLWGSASWRWTRRRRKPA